eukprot:scaffold43088_cov64-Phaeocystis_antarctica.AAC.4
MDEGHEPPTSVKSNSLASSATTSTDPERASIASEPSEASWATARPEKAVVSPPVRSSPPLASSHVPSSTICIFASVRTADAVRTRLGIAATSHPAQSPDPRGQHARWKAIAWLTQAPK